MNILIGEIGNPRSFNFVELLTIKRKRSLSMPAAWFSDPANRVGSWISFRRLLRRAGESRPSKESRREIPSRSFGGGEEGDYAGRVLICASDVMAGSEHPVHGISTARDQDPPTRRLLLPFFFLFPGTLPRITSSSSSSPSSGSQCSDRFRRFVRQTSFASFFFLSLTSSFLHLVRWWKLRAVDLCLEMKTWYLRNSQTEL